MEPFDDVGMFWLPTDPDRTVSGHLKFDGKTFTLTVDGNLSRVEQPESGEFVLEQVDWVVHSVVLGRLRTVGKVTLLDVGGLASHPFFADGKESWTPTAALLGAAVADPRFGSVSFSFDLLVPWVKPPSLVAWEMAGTRIGTVDVNELTLDEVALDEATIKLTANVHGQMGDAAIDVRRQCWVNVDLSPMSVRDVLNEWVRPVQDLLIVLLGRPVRLTELTVEETEPQEGRKRPRTLQVVFGGLLVAPTTAEGANLRSWGTSTICVREDLPVGFGELLRGWLAARELFGEAITLLCSPFYAPFMYSEHRYASTFQSAESIARAKYAGAQQSREDHRQRVSAIVDAARAAGASNEDLAWAEAVLRSRNDKPLKQLIDELLVELGPLGQPVLRKNPNFARTAASARARVSHPGGEGLSTPQRHWYGEVLSWLVRAQLLAEAGLPLEVISDLILRRSHFTQTVDRLEPPPDEP